MVSTHSGCSISNANTFYCSWIIGRHSLTLNHRSSLHAVGFSSNCCSISQYAAKRSAFSYFFYKIDSSLSISEFGQTCFHYHSNSSSHFNSIKPEIIIHAVQYSNSIQIIDSAIGPVSPNCFIFGLFCQVISVFIVIDSRALNHTASVASVSSESSSFCLQLNLRFTAYS